MLTFAISRLLRAGLTILFVMTFAFVVPFGSSVLP